MVYEYYNNTIAVHARWLYEEASIVSYDNYKKLVKRGWLNLVRRACRNTPALVEFHSMRQDIKEQVVKLAGDPSKKLTRNQLEELVIPDSNAFNFYSSYRKPNGDPLPFETQKKYATNAMIMNAIREMINNHQVKARALGQTKSRMWQNLSRAVNNITKFEHSLPGNHRRLQAAYEKYSTLGYDAFIHRGQGNDNSAKIVGDVAKWWLAMYSMPNKPMLPALLVQYNHIREKNGWPELTESAVLLWLNKPENKRMWVISRDGKSEYNKLFGYKITRKKDDWFPNAYWAIDGTKLDWIHYLDNELGMAAKLKINPVIDVYSEKILGWSYSETETHIDHFVAMKQACARSESRPYLITYDNQSGHKSSRMQEMYSNIVAKEKGTHYPHKAYRSSNPIEQLFSRFQQQVLNQLWFSDKQSIKARSIHSKPNMDFIKEFKHLLKTKEELLKAFEYCVKLWNESEHPRFKGQSRNEVYQHTQPMREELDISEMVNIFWVNETQPIKYRPNGLIMKLSGQSYEFEVFDEDGKIDLEFRRKYVGERFHVRYDPELMDEGIQLWLNDSAGKRFIAIAEPKRKHESIPALMKEGDKESWHEDFMITEQEYARDLAEIQKIQQEVGMTPEIMIEEQELVLKFAGDVPKDIRSNAESVLNRL